MLHQSVLVAVKTIANRCRFTDYMKIFVHYGRSVRNRESVFYKYNKLLKSNHFKYEGKDSCMVQQKYRGFVVALSLMAFVKSLFGFDDEEKEDKMITMIKEGILAKEREAYDAAEQILHIALKTAQERDDSQAVSYIFDIMANVAFEQGYYEKSEALFKEVLKRIISDGTSPSDNAVIHVSVKLAEIYAKTDRFDLAESGYLFCLETQERKVSGLDAVGDETDADTRMLYAIVLDSYAKYLHERRRGSGHGVSHEKRALSLCQTWAGDAHPQCVTLLNDLASMLSECGHLAEAGDFLTAAVARARDTQHEHLPTFLLNLGLLRLMDKDVTEAAALCRESLQLAKLIDNHHLMDSAKECVQNANKRQRDAH